MYWDRRYRVHGILSLTHFPAHSIMLLSQCVIIGLTTLCHAQGSVLTTICHAHDVIQYRAHGAREECTSSLPPPPPTEHLGLAGIQA